MNLAPPRCRNLNQPSAGPRNNRPIVIQRHLRAVDEHAQPFAMVQKRSALPSRLESEADQLPGGLREQAVERLFNAPCAASNAGVWRLITGS